MHTKREGEKRDKTKRSGMTTIRRTLGVVFGILALILWGFLAYDFMRIQWTLQSQSFIAWLNPLSWLHTILVMAPHWEYWAELGAALGVTVVRFYVVPKEDR